MVLVVVGRSVAGPSAFDDYADDDLRVWEDAKR